MNKKLLSVVGIVAVMLAVTILPAAGCAPAQQAPPAAPAAPEGKVWKWYPSSWLSSGIDWDKLVLISDYITRASGGRIECSPTTPGAICPVDEQLDAVASGATDAMMPFPDYFSGKIPLMGVVADALYLVDDTWELYQYLEKQNDGRILKLWSEEIHKYGNAELIAPSYYPLQMMAVSKVPLYGIDDIPGTKFRCGDVPVADPLGKLGASVVWFPGTEIYTNLASGVVDAVTFCSSYDSIAMGFQEVTKYWIRKPIFGPVLADMFVVNGDVWRELPDDLKAVVESAIQAGNAYSEYNSIAEIAEGWVEAEQAGIEIIEWSDEDVLSWKKAVASFFPEYAKDAASTEAVEILKDFIKQWKPDLAKLLELT
jgi:TRAP-type mannitol/chloroaromatic compound transport system substrate-binding protein